MEAQDLIERINKDARNESAKILREANKNAKANIEFAEKHAEELIKEARENLKKSVSSETEINTGIADLHKRLEILSAKTKIVDAVFEEAMNSVKYNFRIEKHPNYELVLTKAELGGELRKQLEARVAEILFNE